MYSEIMQNLVDSVNEFINKSAKVDYSFTLEDRQALERLILVLTNHMKILDDYELNKNK